VGREVECRWRRCRGGVILHSPRVGNGVSFVFAGSCGEETGGRTCSFCRSPSWRSNNPPCRKYAGATPVRGVLEGRSDLDRRIVRGMGICRRMLVGFPPGLEIKLDEALEGQLAARPRAGDGRMSSSSSAKEFGLVLVKVKVRGPGERCQLKPLIGALNGVGNALGLGIGKS
jgi:hypothetical protein